MSTQESAMATQENGTGEWHTEECHGHTGNWHARSAGVPCKHAIRRCGYLYTILSQSLLQCRNAGVGVQVWR